MLHILLMKISRTVLLLIPYRFHIIFEPARLRIACRQVRLSVCRQTGRQASWTAGRLERGQACRPACVCLYAFVYCTILLLLYYYVDRRMYCTTDLYHSNSTSLKPQSIADAFIWSFAVVNQYDSKTVNQHIIETMLLPICIGLLSWLSGSVHRRFCKSLVCWACEQARMYLLKIAFPY